MTSSLGGFFSPSLYIFKLEGLSQSSQSHFHEYASSTKYGVKVYSEKNQHLSINSSDVNIILQNVLVISGTLKLLLLSARHRGGVEMEYICILTGSNESRFSYGEAEAWV